MIHTRCQESTSLTDTVLERIVICHWPESLLNNIFQPQRGSLVTPHDTKHIERFGSTRRVQAQYLFSQDES